MSGAIIAAIIGGIVAIVVAVVRIWDVFFFDIDLYVHGENRSSVRPTLTLKTSGEIKKIRETDDDGYYRFRRLRNGKYSITVSADKYKTQIIEFDQNDPKIDVRLKRTDVSTEYPFSLKGWSVWGGITVDSTELHTIVISGAVQVAGYVSEYIDTVIAGRTLILEVKNSGKSTFNRERMFKLVYNPEDKLLKPREIPSLIESEYIPAADGRFTFTIPQDFSGKLQFVFFQPTLNNLTISAWYE